MVAIRVDSFQGLAPAVPPIKLADGAATATKNTRVNASSLLPEKQPTVLEAVPPNTKTIFLWQNTYWFTSTDNLAIVESPVAADVHKRLYFAGGDYPTYTAATVATTGWSSSSTIVANPSLPVTEYRLGVLAPDDITSVVIEGTAVEDSSALTTSYVYTYVSEFGEEGPPSNPTDLVTYETGETRQLNFPTLPSFAGRAMGSGSKIRVYRTATGSTASDFLFVTELALSTPVYVDATSDAELGEVLSTEGHFRPLDDDLSYAPDGPLQTLVSLPGGFLSGFAGKTLCFSERFLPHAWNPQNFLTTESDIVQIVDTALGLIVLTKTKPYIALGSDPSAMSIMRIDADQACISKRSAVDMGGAVFYASPDGIVSIAGEQTTVITDRLLTRDQWQEYNPSSIVGTNFEGRYYAFYEKTNGTKGCLVFDAQNPEAPLMEIDLYAEAAHSSFEQDKLYLAVDDNLVTFGTGPNYEMTWRSKHYFIPTDVNFAWARVVAEGRVQFRIYMDGIKIVDQRVEDSQPFRLPANTRGRILEVELVEFDQRVDSIVVATSRAEV